MANLFDYIEWRGDIPFEQVPFGKIDASVLSQIVYLQFEGLMSSSFNDKIPLYELADRFETAPDFETRKYMGVLINENTPQLLFELSKSERFKNIKLCAFESILDEQNTEQFAAITFLINDLTVIAFRGTDDTIVGWKEDFNIAYMPVIPSQESALDYANKIASAVKGDICICGHSKGGNLALYSAVNLSKCAKKRLRAVYNFDGPGFPSQFFTSKDFLSIEDKLVSVYPGFSVVGMIFSHPEKFQIAKSNGKGLLQHDMLSWQIMGNNFIEEFEFSDKSQFFYKAFNEWVNNLEREQIQKFVKAFFDVIEASGAKTNTDIEKSVVKSAARMLKEYNNLEPDTRLAVHRILRILQQVIQNQLPMLGFINPASAHYIKP